MILKPFSSYSKQPKTTFGPTYLSREATPFFHSQEFWQVFSCSGCLTLSTVLFIHLAIKGNLLPPFPSDPMLLNLNTHIFYHLSSRISLHGFLFFSFRIVFLLLFLFFEKLFYDNSQFCIFLRAIPLRAVLPRVYPTFLTSFFFLYGSLSGSIYSYAFFSTM